MRTLKVYLQSPWKWTDSPYYKYLRENPPVDIKYINAQSFKLIQNKNELRIKNWIKQTIKKNIKRFYSSMPNVHYTKDAGKYDLIHCAHCLSKNKQPWVCDIEHVGQFWASGITANKKIVRKFLTSAYCKKILAWTECSKKNILKEFPEIEDKVEVVYPVVPLPKIKKKKSNKVKLLFVGRDFEMKGGEIAVMVINKLTRKYDNVEGVIVSDTPLKVLNKYKENKKIKFYGLMSHEKLFNEIYPNADIFIYPTFSDTFGFAILEAQSFGLPVIAMKTYSTHTLKETISEGKTGFVIENMSANANARTFDEKIIKGVVEKVERLIKDKKLLKLMRKNTEEEIREGKFSIKRRNEKLEKIYRKAVE